VDELLQYGSEILEDSLFIGKDRAIQWPLSSIDVEEIEVNGKNEKNSVVPRLLRPVEMQRFTEQYLPILNNLKTCNMT
jgi:hypothetical protein